jgi:hypothetical protein
MIIFQMIDLFDFSCHVIITTTAPATTTTTTPSTIYDPTGKFFSIDFLILND